MYLAEIIKKFIAENIEVHSRWTVHTLEELEYRQNRDNQELQNLAIVLEQDGVKIVWIK